jgi:ABC-type multidrug transport system ATPase subunit
VIELDDVTIAMRGRTILNRCTAVIKTAGVTRLAGPNGSGKSTLIRAIAGIQRYSGDIRFDGMDVARVRAHLYVCFDDAALFPFLSGWDNLRVLIGRPVSRSRLAPLEPLVDAHLLSRKARQFSHGQRRRLHLAAALASDARYLVFDEALDGLDADGLVDFKTALRTVIDESARTILVTGHDDTILGPLVTNQLVITGGTLAVSA